MSSDQLNPKIDFVFRRLFGSEENKDLLISLINSIVDPMPHIVDVGIKNPFNLAAYLGAKESILDIRAVDQSGTWYDIEMQVESHIFYGRRALYYVSKTYTDQLESGEDYSALNTAIGIHFSTSSTSMTTACFGSSCSRTRRPMMHRRNLEACVYTSWKCRSSIKNGPKSRPR